MKWLLKFVFPDFATESGNSVSIIDCMYCIAFHWKVIICDPPNCIFPFLFSQKLVIRKWLCDLLGVDGPMCGRKHFRIIDCKNELMCFNNARFQSTKPAVQSSRACRKIFTVASKWMNCGLSVFNVSPDTQQKHNQQQLANGCVVKSCCLVKSLPTCG